MDYKNLFLPFTITLICIYISEALLIQYKNGSLSEMPDICDDTDCAQKCGSIVCSYGLTSRFDRCCNCPMCICLKNCNPETTTVYPRNCPACPYLQVEDPCGCQCPQCF